MLVSPMDVVLSDDTVVQPDLLYIAKDRRHLVKDRVEGSPDLVIEIISPGTSRRDRTEKLDLYAKHGVPEYWIVDPESLHIEFLLLEGDRYTVIQSTENTYRSSHNPEVEIELEKFWEEVQQRLNKP